ncbi:hypothetical protein CNY89_01090 [Amaricoccus sp. HAR-UPW-R2A-40]|nr:hypothetical protein CNY89_01090 [Amaricoccus sp. HAR-UPW-R2A-40]
MGVSSFQPGANSFGRHGVAITPSDAADIPGGAVKAVVTTSAGDLSIIPADSATAIAFTGVGVGFIPPYVVRRVTATGTTATVATVEA